MQSTWKQLIEGWRLQRLPIQKGCSPAQIEIFETKYKITLPADLKEYFKQVNGMSDYFPGDHDEEGFSFWSLQRMKTLTEDRDGENNENWRLEEGNSFFLFCDYLVWCWAYALYIVRPESKVEGIYLVCCRNPIMIAESFSEFIRLYLEKSDKLYPPTYHQHI